MNAGALLGSSLTALLVAIVELVSFCYKRRTTPAIFTRRTWFWIFLLCGVVAGLASTYFTSLLLGKATARSFVESFLFGTVSAMSGSALYRSPISSRKQSGAVEFDSPRVANFFKARDWKMLSSRVLLLVTENEEEARRRDRKRRARRLTKNQSIDEFRATLGELKLVLDGAKVGAYGEPISHRGLQKSIDTVIARLESALTQEDSPRTIEAVQKAHKQPFAAVECAKLMEGLEKWLSRGHVDDALRDARRMSETNGPRNASVAASEDA
jgi:hypothetical protein